MQETARTGTRFRSGGTGTETECRSSNGDPATLEPTPPAEAGRWCIVVRSERGEHDSPFEVRIRRWLKAGLRGFGLRCVECRERTDAEVIERLTDEVLRLEAEVVKLRRHLVLAKPRRKQTVAIGGE